MDESQTRLISTKIFSQSHDSFSYIVLNYIAKVLPTLHANE